MTVREFLDRVADALEAEHGANERDELAGPTLHRTMISVQRVLEDVSGCRVSLTVTIPASDA